MRILFCNIGWMEGYRGLQTGASIKGGGAFVVKEGHGLEVCNFDDHVEWAPGVGQFHAADLTWVRDCSSSKRLGLRYPRAECRRLSL